MKNAKFEKLRIFAVLPEAMTSMIDQLPVCHSDLCLQLCAVCFFDYWSFCITLNLLVLLLSCLLAGLFILFCYLPQADTFGSICVSFCL